MIPNTARVWNYVAGGKDNYKVDELAGEVLRDTAPQITTMARESRLYRSRAVTLLASKGITQFLDIGTGLPTGDNTHEVAQRVAPDARIVYVDNDPNVVNHAQNLSVSTRAGHVAAVNADLHDPDAILAAARDHLDLSQPVALMLMGVMGHIEDHADATAIVRRLLAGLSPGSYFVHYDCTDTSVDLVKAQDNYNRINGVLPYILRSPDEIASYYEGLELLAPGIVSCPLWRPDLNPKPDPADPDHAPDSPPQYTDIHGGVARQA
ncbi:SAM-dependent methyltransferase [Streptomyces sp. NPDC013161]|uniref:SAM-dependent methyltransferase n=1 Tax=Streptomyces sp. NPDC013161 TaxID=3364862 RepID=UPI003690E250